MRLRTRLAPLTTFLGIIALAYTVSAEPALNAKSDALVDEAIAAGRWKVGGSAFYMKSENGGVAYGLSPSADYFILNRLTLGLETEHWWNDQGMAYHAVRPSIGYYFLTLDPAAFFIKQHANWIWNSYAQGNPELSWMTRVGVDYFLNKNVALTPSVTYSYGGSVSKDIAGHVGFSVFF